MIGIIDNLLHFYTVTFINSICKYSLDAKMVISTSPIINNCIGVILPSKAPIDINTDAAAISAPIKFPSDNLRNAN